MSEALRLLGEALDAFEEAKGAINTARYIDGDDPSGEHTRRYAQEALLHGERAAELIVQANLAIGTPTKA